MKLPEKLSETRILISNDDGINAPGLKVLEKIARTLSKDVWVVAPQSEQSGVSHSLTLHTPLRIHKLGAKRYSVSGTPTDCVLLAVKTIVPRNKPVQLVLSGINSGANLAEDVTYSGTVAATMEGTLLQIPSIAFSMARKRGGEFHWETAEEHAPALIRKLLKLEWPASTLININFPACTPDKVKGVKIAPLGQRQINEKIETREDPFGRKYYWVGTPLHDDYDRDHVDLAWAGKGYITVTPLTLDLTHYKMLESMRGQFET